MKSLFQILLLSILFTPFLKAQQSKTMLIHLDSLENGIDIFKENVILKNQEKAKLSKKLDNAILVFQKNYESFIKEMGYCEFHNLYEKKRNKLALEQSNIIRFENDINKVDSILHKELKNWAYDYIKKEVRYYCFSNNLKAEFTNEKSILILSPNQNIAFEIIKSINQSKWKEAHSDFFNFIKNKVLFEFNLD